MRDGIAKVGWVSRDVNGTYTGSGQGAFGNRSNSIEAECQALLMGMQNAWCNEFQHVIFEGDCKELHDLVQGCKKNLSYITGCVIWIMVIKIPIMLLYLDTKAKQQGGRHLSSIKE